MKLAFLDYSGWNYTLETPLHEPMGGSESALCYLCYEMVRLGHEIAIFNGITDPFSGGTCGGTFNIRSLLETAAPGRLNEFDAVIVLNRAEGRDLRERLRVSVPLVLWTQHDVNQPAVKPLIGRKEVNSWTAIAYVSDWQRQRYEGYFQVPHDRGQVMRNAASPAFIDAEKTEPWFMTGEYPVLVYTSTPFRGLDVLLKAFPKTRESTGATLKVFSSMAVYKAPDQQFQALYDQAKAMEGVEYSGSLGQIELARQISGAAALAYPSTFPETSCIATIEAMAVGAEVFTTRLGALPETCAGWQHDVAFTLDPDALAKNFAEMVIDRLDVSEGFADRFVGPRNGRMNYVRQNYTWALRAKQWEAWLSSLMAGKAEAAE